MCTRVSGCVCARVRAAPVVAAAHLRLGRRLGLFELFSGFSALSFVVNPFDFVNELLPIIVLAGGEGAGNMSWPVVRHAAGTLGD